MVADARRDTARPGELGPNAALRGRRIGEHASRPTRSESPRPRSATVLEDRQGDDAAVRGPRRLEFTADHPVPMLDRPERAQTIEDPRRSTRAHRRGSAPRPPTERTDPAGARGTRSGGGRSSRPRDPRVGSAAERSGSTTSMDQDPIQVAESPTRSLIARWPARRHRRHRPEHADGVARLHVPRPAGSDTRTAGTARRLPAVQPTRPPGGEPPAAPASSCPGSPPHRRRDRGCDA